MVEAAKIKVSAVNEDVLREIIGIYAETVGGKYFDPSEVQSRGVLAGAIEDLKQVGQLDLRLGSRLSVHSKFKVVTAGYSPDDQSPQVRFDFYHNTDNYGPETDKLRDTFVERVNEYLAKKQLL